MEGVGAYGLYDDGSSPYAPAWAGGLGGKGNRDRGVGPFPVGKVDDRVYPADERNRTEGWPFPLGGKGELF